MITYHQLYHQSIFCYPILLIGNVRHDFYHHQAHFNFWDTYLKNNPGRSAKLDNRKPKNSPSSLRARLFDPMKNVIKMMQFSIYITNRWALYSVKNYGLRSSFRWEKAIKTINQPKKRASSSSNVKSHQTFYPSIMQFHFNLNRESSILLPFGLVCISLGCQRKESSYYMHREHRFSYLHALVYMAWQHGVVGQ